MDKARREQIDELFHAACEIDPAARKAYLDERCGDDPEIRGEVESLLAHHDPRTIIAPPDARDREPVLRLRPPTLPGRASRRMISRTVMWSAVAAFVLGGVGVWGYRGTHATIRRNLESGLGNLLEANTAALVHWLEHLASLTESWADREATRRAVISLLATDAPGGATSVPLTEDLQELVDRGTAIGFAIIDRSDRVWSYRDFDVTAQLSPDGHALLDPAFRDETIVMPPIRLSDLGEELARERDVPTVIAAAPVHDDDGRVIAVAVISLRADAEFARVLQLAQFGDTGETYAFDEEGMMLSPSRFEPDLRTVGLLPDEPDSTSVLGVQIRDPGGDLAAGHVPEFAPAARPLTHMAAHATAGIDGVSVDSYRNYRGVRVVGAWRWLKAYRLGVATEIEVHEAFSAMNHLRRVFWILFGLLAAAVIGVVAASFVAGQLRQRLGEVQQLGRYTLQAVIGEGGMGRVYEARHAMLRRPTAIKVLRTEATDPQTIARFEREVQLTSQLTHPNTIVIYDYGRTDDGAFYYAMEYLPGITLSDLVDLAGPLSAARAVHILRQASASLADAHARGLVHRDVKPHNIIVCERGGMHDFVKVLDFGLVKAVDPGAAGQITSTMELSGTPLYIAPERLQDPRLVDVRSDVYSLGAVAFYLLTGRPVFEGINVADIYLRLMNEPAPRASSVAGIEIPPDLDRLVTDCLARDPEERPARMRDVLQALDVLARDDPWDPEDARRWWTDDADRITALIASRREPVASRASRAHASS